MFTYALNVWRYYLNVVTIYDNIRSACAAAELSDANAIYAKQNKIDKVMMLTSTFDTTVQIIFTIMKLSTERPRHTNSFTKLFQSLFPFGCGLFSGYLSMYWHLFNNTTTSKALQAESEKPLANFQLIPIQIQLSHIYTHSLIRSPTHT